MEDAGEPCDGIAEYKIKSAAATSRFVCADADHLQQTIHLLGDRYGYPVEVSEEGA